MSQFESPKEGLGVDLGVVTGSATQLEPELEGFLRCGDIPL